MQRLWLDSNSARNPKRMREVVRLARGKGVRVTVNPQVYLERRRQMRVEKGDAFSAVAFDDLLGQLGIEVPPLVLDQRTAATWADELYQRYPTSEAWEAAKRSTLGG